MRKTLYALSLLLVASTSHAADFGIGLSNTAVAADYTSAPAGQGLEFTVSGLRNTERGSLISAGMQVSQQVNPTFKVSVGGKLVGVFNSTRDASALALGGRVDMTMPNNPNIHVGVHGWFAPTVTSFNDSKNFRDLGASVGYRVMDNAEIFAAYRFVRINYDHLDARTIEDGPLFGLKMSF